MPHFSQVPEPWKSFLGELDREATVETRLDCMGGFVATLLYGLPRATSALDPYDLALSKLERNIQRDRDDVKHLAQSVPLDLKILKERYEKELRWQLGNPEREDLTLKLWTEMIEEERSGAAGRRNT